MTLIKGELYTFENDTTVLVYLGENYSGNGYWHQLAKEESPTEVWCEMLYDDIKLIKRFTRGEGI